MLGVCVCVCVAHVFAAFASGEPNSNVRSCAIVYLSCSYFLYTSVDR